MKNPTGIGSRLLSFLTFSAVIISSRQQQPPLVVDIGRSAELQPRHILMIPPGDNMCRIEVQRNDPMSQRVGTLQPTEFDCDFPPQNVFYHHSGSPLLEEDRVKLIAYVFAANETITSVTYVNIRVAKTPYAIIVPGIVMQVSRFFALSNRIDASVLRFRYQRKKGTTCMLHFSRYRSTPPLLGQIKEGNETLTSVDFMHKDCDEFLQIGIRYKHLRPPSPNVDYLPLEIEVTEDIGIVRKERYYLPIRIGGGFPNTPPKAAFSSSYIMEADEFVLTPLDEFVLAAIDSETPADALVFNVTKLPTEGYFVHVGDRSRSITAFTQADVNKGEIAYSPPTVSYPEKKVITAEFVVFDNHFAASQPITLHIAVQPSSGTAPRVYLNAGLTVLEGHSRPITTQNLHIVDRDNIDKVKVVVLGGLRHGTLEVNGSTATWFSPSDIEHGRVTYHHDDSDTPRDSIMLSITDEEETTRIKFPIDILQRDDSPPYLVNNVGLVVSEGSYVHITKDVLSAHDKDSKDSSLAFIVVTEPEAGGLVRRLRSMTLGHRIDTFTQDEISRGYIYYHHFGGEKFDDSFEFKIIDTNDPPNRSGKHTMTVHVTVDNDMPPHQVAGSLRHMMVDETKWMTITKEELHYTDDESDDRDLVFTVTTAPYFLKSAITSDAGRIVSTDELKLSNGNATNLHPLTQFTQREVNHGKVAYVPPVGDIGTLRRHAQFVFSVADQHGNSVLDQTFDVTVMPVNNLAPRLTVRELHVKEGGATKISTSEISAYDPDSDHSQLTFFVTEMPNFGQILKGEIPLYKGDSFRLTDITSSSMRYIHDGSSVETDVFVIRVSDGVNAASERVPIRVRLVDDEIPFALRKRDAVIEVTEGGTVLLTTADVAATDNDTDDGVLMFTVLQSPQFGRLEMDGHQIREFSQHDVWMERVSYVHSAGETGSAIAHDRITLTLSDTPYRYDGGVVGLNITIKPVDTESPAILLGSPLFVNECEKAPLTPEVISANDADTTSDRLSFVISEQPRWGFLENTTPDPGSEISNAGRAITSFTLSDIQQGLVNYVQKNCSGVEPHQDRVVILVTDGKRHSRKASIDIIIVPENDEVPVFELSDLTVDEGGEKVIGPRMINISDADEPNDNLKLRVEEAPRHGKLVLLKHGRQRSVAEGSPNETPLNEVSVFDLLHNTYIVYKHDGSESVHDSLTLRVSDGRHNVTRGSEVHVRASNDEPVRLTRNRALQMEYGGARAITARVLKSTDSDSSGTKIQYVLLRVPQKGSLQLQTDDHWKSLSVGENFTQVDIGRGAVRYVHTKALQRARSDDFVFRVTDGYSAVEHQTFNVRFPKTGDGVALLVKDATVAVGGRVTVNTDVLSASDDTGRPEEIVFTVTSAPKHGRFTTARRGQTNVTEFNQLDLAAQTLYYEHTGTAHDEVDSFVFKVVNSMNATKTGIVHVRIQSADAAPPTLDVNVALTVPQGETMPMTSANLHVSDPDTSPSRLLYTVAEPPHLGRLLREGKPVEQFSQGDIDTGRIGYENRMRDDLGMDYFLFNVTDLRASTNEDGGYFINGTRQTKPAFFSILIQPPAAQLPRLIVNRKPETLEVLDDGRYGFVIDARYLKATHTQTAAPDILYTLLQRPRRGELRHTSRKRNVRRRFTQQDVDKGHIVYVLTGENDDDDDDDDADRSGEMADESNSDSFTFRVQDRSNNALDNQKFELEWSSVQFIESQFNVCEDVGTFSLTITRKGALSQSAFVDIVARGRSATEGDDFKPSKTKQLQFNPGVETVYWAMEIADDSLEEETEKLKVTLKNPVNTVLGSPEKTIVYIINLHKGRCAEYLGMVSKKRPTPMALDTEKRVLPHRGLDKSKTSTLRMYHKIKAIEKDDAKKKLKITKKDMKSFGHSEKSPQMATDKHPMKKYRDRQKERRRKRKQRRHKNGKRGSRNRRFGRSFLAEQPVVRGNGATELKAWTVHMAPQACNRDSRGLLYTDLHTSQTYRCNGRAWVSWNNAMSYLNPNPIPSPKTTPSKHDLTSNGKSGQTQCRKGWRHDAHHGCYKLMPTRGNWEEAEDMCIEAGGHITEAMSEKQLKWLSKLARGRHFWIGLNDRKKRGRWTYTSGSDAVFTNWQVGFPKKQPSLAKNCALVAQGLKWLNRVCKKNLAKVICSGALPSN